MRATIDEPNYGYAGELPDDVQSYDYDLDMLTGTERTEDEAAADVAIQAKRRKVSKNLLRQATAATLLTTSLIGSGLGASEAAKGTERITEGTAVLDTFTNKEVLNAAHEIAYGYEKGNGGGFEVVGVKDFQESPSELPASLQDRTRVQVTYKLTLSEPASRAIDAYDNTHRTEDAMFYWLQPSLNAHQAQPGNGEHSDTLLHPGLVNSDGKLALADDDFHSSFETSTVLNSQKDSEGRHVYEVDRYIYPLKGDVAGNHEPIHIQLYSYTELLDRSGESKGVIDSTVDGDETIVMRDGTWQLDK